MMDRQKQGEICRDLVKLLANREGVERVTENLHRLQGISSQTGIPIVELVELTKIIVDELVDENFAKKVK